ncbi:ABC transporter ATP-binding protein [Pseudonocardia xishanensis]|uniref:ABC transporter ATP-binding protein n=1 Tax=Pseudonocardia xishanensis TaxID=630995 RepID=A0ABP8RTQ4_9PSEU
MNEVLEVQGLEAGYEGRAVVHGIDLSVGRGEIVALLGANGAGKSTTLRTVSGLLRPLGGHVRLDGVDLTGRPAHRVASAGLVLVPEGRALARGLTVEENLRLVAFPSWDPLTLFPELGELRRRRVGLLSGGEQQMLAVARALTMSPKVLLVDELSFGLSPKVVARLLTALRELATKTGLGVLLVEQHVQQVLEVADRGCVLRQGALVADRPAADLLADRSVLEAGYLGDTATPAVAVRGATKEPTR